MFCLSIVVSLVQFGPGDNLTVCQQHQFPLTYIYLIHSVLIVHKNNYKLKILPTNKTL